MDYMDDCDICGVDAIYIEDFGYTLCYDCFITNPGIQRDLNKKWKDEATKLGY